ncbi:hypothetical protein [Paenibacillus brevis]|uniref:Uncharacterized protein n=1 Tax=Paenibacillus brevis TaxID=2841508 RepID=A0ABS6FL58_9BACL|nr:hypothetical protein [Paenibacillus brevis]MBU5670232.1 hypothetical protein [Paenibacillus brevis]
MFNHNRFGFKVKEETKKMGILLGYKSNEDIKLIATYIIKNKDGESLASGQIEDGAVESKEIAVPNGETEFIVEFESESTNNVGVGYIIWDESWIEN